MANLWVHPFIFSSKKVGDVDCLLGRKRKIFAFFCSVNETGFTPGLPQVSLCSVNKALEVVKCRSSICDFHKNQLSRKLRQRQKLVFLLNKVCT